MTTLRKRVAVLISGRGSNMTTLIESAKVPGYPAEIAGVISDRADAAGLRIADSAGIVTKVLERRDYPTKEAHDAAVGATLRAWGVEIVCLAGYMRLLTAPFVEEWQGRMINIHPALLPLFKGVDTHRKALEAGVRLHGCSVHFVTAEMDGGPIIAQAAVPVLPDDSPGSLAARVLKAEHGLYPMALRLVAEGKARMEGTEVRFDGAAASPPQDWVLYSLATASDDIDVEALARFTP